MKGWTKRRIALILALALLASQMSACKKETGSAGSNAAENNNPAISVDKDAQKPEEINPAATEAPGVLEWLQENLENIHQSLLEGDYAKVIEQLLGVQDSLANNAHFNALLYIAYMGNGEEGKATALLANVDPSEFADAFLESAEALKGNADIEAIKRKLMDSMMELSQTNPAGFAAVANIGANIQNSNPDDPTIYAARYIAALSMGDQAAIDAILAEAKAHGITAETLSTTTVEYIETHNVTSITVQDAERGITTSTVYNAQGQATKSKVVITKEDGSQEIRIDNARGTLMAVIYVNPNGKIEKRVEYFHSDTPDENGNTLKGYNVYTYQNGVLTNQTLYTADDVAVYDLVYDENGTVTDGYRVVRGQKKPLSKEERDALGCVKDDEGNVIQMSQPKYDENGALIGKTVTDYDYTVNTRGLPRKQSEYDAENKLVSSQTREYSYDSNRDGVLIKIEYTYYDADENVTGGGYVDYQNNKEAEYRSDKSRYVERELDKAGRVVKCDTYTLTKDEAGNPAPGSLQSTTYSEYLEDGVKESTTQYNDGRAVMYTERLYAADGKTVKRETIYAVNNAGEKQLVTDTIYNEDGSYQVIESKEINDTFVGIATTYDSKDRKIAEQVYDLENDKVVSQTEYQYNEDGTVRKVTYRDFNEDSKPQTIEITALEKDGREIYTNTYDADGKLVSQTNYAYDENNNLKYKVTVDTGTGNTIEETCYAYDAESGNLSREETCKYDPETGSPEQAIVIEPLENRKTVIDFENGQETKQTEYRIGEDETEELVAIRTPFYDENGEMVYYCEETYDEDGNPVIKYYDPNNNEIEKPEDLELAAEGTGENSLNPAPEESEETEDPTESEDGEDPTLPGIPDIPGLPDISDIPGMPDISEIPGLPDISDIPGMPDISEIPGLPDISDVPGLPDISEIPGLPDISEIPGLPDISEIPGLPDISEIPGLPDISEIPGLPDISEIPGLPDISEIPGASDFLENMGYGEIAEYVESLKDSEHPEDVEVPDFREYFENTEDPGFLKVAEAVDRIQHPEEPQEPETQETEAAEEETTEAPAEPEPAPVEPEKPETPELPKAPEEAKKPEEPEEPDTPEEPEVPAGE